jgi:hypothetical protein
MRKLHEQATFEDIVLFLNLSELFPIYPGVEEV